MKRWAFITVLLYGISLVLLSVPALLMFGLKWSTAKGFSLTWQISLQEALEIMAHWGYWLWLGVMLSAQALLLLVPVRAETLRLKPRRPLLLPIMVTAFLVANLFLAGVFAVSCTLFGDDAFEPLVWLGEASHAAFDLFPPTRQLLASPGVDAEFVTGLSTTLGIIGLLWMIWTLIFYRYARADDPDALIKRAVRWLLRGSILELLVAVPSHVIVRGRNDCCAPGGTFWGIVTGLSVMLLSFGPGVLLLFAERFSRLRRAQRGENQAPAKLA